MKRVKRRRFSGCVCEQIVYNISDRTADLSKSRPVRPRFQDEEERAAHRTAISRRKFQRLINSFGSEGRYTTLTLNNEDEVHSFAEARRLRDNYVRRLTYRYPDAKVVIVMGRGKHTDRIHYHMVSEGIPEEEISRLWGLGDVIRITKLKAHNYYDGVDHGRDYTGLANYLFDHWTPEQGGHRWKQTRNVKEPKPEAAVEVKQEYSVSRPPRAPKGFFLVEAVGNRYGFLYFKYVMKPEPIRKKNQTGV
jgi:hypothetical protein